jgi:MSHA pilin protein MshA
MNGQQGFTLIELVMVIVILGILSAVAVPKFVNLSDEANQAAVNGVAGSLSSASASNYAVRKATTSKGSAVADCTDVGNLLQTTLSGYTITAAAVAADAVATCTVTGGGSKTATFTALCVS